MSPTFFSGSSPTDVASLSVSDRLMMSPRLYATFLLWLPQADAERADRLRQMLALSAQAEDDLVRVLQSAKHRPSPLDADPGREPPPPHY